MSPVNSLWFKWKSLRLPWRRSFLVGSDLAGNTFWEFKDALNSKRFRRIVKTNPKTHFADVKVSPQWHQWLRHVRPEPPSLEEQRQDLVRQAQIKQLAQLADERWASKPSYLDRPQTQQPGLAMQGGDSTAPNTTREARNGGHAPGVSAADSRPKTESIARSEQKGAKEDPFFKSKGAPGEKWQPDSWTPNASKR